MLDVIGFAVFVGRECCVRFFKPLKWLKSLPSPFDVMQQSEIITQQWVLHKPS